MIVHERDPYNAEPDPADLAAAGITPHGVFYVRNHGPIPQATDDWALHVGGLVERPLSIGLDALRGSFRHREVVATLQCAGNRRAGLLAVKDIPGEAPWGAGATGTARWGGVALGDLLEACGPLPEARHVGMVGADVSAETSPPEAFGGSIPLGKALREEVLIAFKMNGEPLPPEHGAPLRTIVPGYIGARSIKWLHGLELRADPWDGFFQATAYRMLPADGEFGRGNGFELGLVALNSDVLVPADGSSVQAGVVDIRGYAFAGGERFVARVDVSTDGGATWAQAGLVDDLGRWAWRRWRASVRLEPGEHEILVRAWDSSAATQPESAASLWNPKGYCNNAQARITVVAE